MFTWRHGILIACVTAAACSDVAPSRSDATALQSTEASPPPTLKINAPTLVRPVTGMAAWPADAPISFRLFNVRGRFASFPVGYEIEVRDAANLVVVDVRFLESEASVVGPTVEWIVAPLPANATYSWRARATFGELVGPWANSTTFRIAPQNPPVAALTITILDSLHAQFALSGVTPVLFDASGSTGDQLTYQIEFGDGHASAGPQATHVYGLEPQGRFLVDGTQTARITVTDKFGRTNVTTRSVGLHSLQGFVKRWLTQDGGPALLLRLQQGLDGRSVSGMYDGPEGRGFSVRGSITGARVLRLTIDALGVDIDGDIHLSDDASARRELLRLRFRGGMFDGQVRDFLGFDSF